MPIKHHVIDVRRDGVWESAKSQSATRKPIESTDQPADNGEEEPVAGTSDIQMPLTEDNQQIASSGSTVAEDSNAEREVIRLSKKDTDNVQLDSSDATDGFNLLEVKSLGNAWNDPVNFINKRMTATVINAFIDKPHQPDCAFQFPVNNGRQFMPSWFHSNMPDGSKVHRKWLSYSVERNTAYCINCILFGGPNASKIWTNSGFSGWLNGHGIRDIVAHESSDQHRLADIAYVQWITNSRVDCAMAERMKSVTDQNRRVVCVAITALQYLATEMIAIRGHNSQEGKFLNLFQLLAQYDASAAAYLEALQSIRSRDTRKKPEVNFLSPLNVRRLLTVMKTLVVERVTQLLDEQRTCSVISDGTQDESKMEAQAVIVRYVEVNEGLCRPVERLLDVFTTGDTSAESLCRSIVNSLNNANVSLEFIVGQSYDGASNMRGKYSGLRTRMLQYANRAHFVWCHAHRLNLVIESMLGCCTDIRKALGLMQELYNFFNTHRRHAVLIKLQETDAHKRTLKRVSDTTRSWRSAEDGVTTVLECFDAISESLECLESEGSDASTVSTASGLLRRLADFHLVVCLHILKFVFRITGSVSRILQGVSVDLAVAVTLIESCLNQLNNAIANSDEQWQQIMLEAKEFADRHAIEPTFPEKRLRRTKKMSDELASDESVQDAEKRVKTIVFRGVLDSVYVQLRERFEAEDLAMMRCMRIFTPACLMSATNITEDDIKELCEFYHVDTSVVLKELNEFRLIYKQLQTHVTMDDLTKLSSRPVSSCDDARPPHVEVGLSVGNGDGSSTCVGVGDNEGTLNDHTETSWIQSGFIKPLRVLQKLSGFTSLHYIYKVLVTLPVTSCSAERAMSRVRIVKNRLRSTMLDDWLSSLLCLASEKDILLNLELNDIVNRFANLSDSLRRQLIYN